MPAGDQVGFAGRIRVNPAIAANPALLRDGTQAVAGGAGGPTAFTPNPTGGPAGFTTLLDRVLDFAFGAEAAAGQAWPGIATAGLGPDGTLASPFTAPATLEAYAGRVTTAQTGDRAAATAAKDQAKALGAALEARFGRQSGVDADTEMASIVALQNAYAANAKVLGTVQALFDTLLGARYGDACLDQPAGPAGDRQRRAAPAAGGADPAGLDGSEDRCGRRPGAAAAARPDAARRDRPARRLWQRDRRGAGPRRHYAGRRCSGCRPSPANSPMAWR